MGIVALEGMAAGIPLLVSSVDGLREIASESQWCRQVSPGDVDGFDRGLRWLDGLNQALPLESLRTRAREFLWDRIVEDYLEIYSQVARID
jgi:glycosyltransferase involved in cell wall biosynthesis